MAEAANISEAVIRLLWEKQFEGSPWAGKFHLIRQDSLATDYGPFADKIIATVRSDMAAKIERLEAERAEMLEALRPFAEVADDFDADGRALKDTDGIYANVAGDFRRARAILARATADR